MKSWRTWLIVILMVSAAWKIILLALDVVPLNSDEAIVGLMARHILQGERPFFYYGQSYYGPLDAYLTSLLFAVFEPNDFALRIVPLAASLLFVIVIYYLGKALYSRQVGLWSAAYAAIAPAFLLVRGLKGDAAYSLVLLISALAPWAVVPLLMLGGAFLCFEGFEKLAHRFLHGKDEDDAEHARLVEAVSDPAIDLVNEIGREIDRDHSALYMNSEFRIRIG